MGYEPKKPNNNNLKCPMKFSYQEIEQYCEGLRCCWFMPIQRACAINCIARLEGLIKGKLEREQQR
ncbi:MAG: hypothetical protein A3K77_06025 [Euryarchaeota archaeon RBG_13_31_8]|nr:MAG: hypothetical protein A3K77_06025 [Euryarchaeota archaeon RBG_13_31_8]